MFGIKTEKSRLEEIEQTFLLIKEVRLKVDKLKTSKQEELDGVAAKYEKDLVKLNRTLESSEEKIIDFARKNTQYFTQKQSVEMRNGIIKKRISSSMEYVKDKKEVLRNLKLFLPDYVRNTESADLARLKADSKKEEVADKLEAIGIELVEKENITIEIL